MTDHACEPHRIDRRIAPLLKIVQARSSELGLECVYLAPDGSRPDGLGAADGDLRRLADHPVGAVVTEGPHAARVRLPLQHRDDDLGSLLVTCRPGSGGAIAPDAELLRCIPSLEQIIRDGLAINELEDEVTDLADQITDAFEMLELMYALGNSMASLDEPQRFLSVTCKRVRQTLAFGYVAVHLSDAADVGPMLAGKTHWDGEAKHGTELKHLDRLLGVMALDGMSLDAFNGPQAIVRPLRNDRGIVGMIIAGDKHREAGNVSSYDTKLIDAVVGLLSAFLTNCRLFNEQREMAMGVLESLSAAIDAKDRYTRGHAQRVAYLSQQIAIGLGLDAAHAERLRVAGLLHDVGKIGVAEAVLQKSGRLTDDEYDQIKRHPEIGHRILKDLKGLEDILPAVLHHHERLDGRGYPAGLTGDSIPLSARIVAAADTFDAMSSTRSYRSKMPREEVIAELRRSAGSQLDPGVVDALLSLDLSEFDRMIAEHATQSGIGVRAA